MEKMRLIWDEKKPASINMACDETLFLGLIRGVSEPTIRLYTWEKPTVSIGYFQKAKDINISLLKEKGGDFVRRPTGGRAVLHWKELTFCLTIPDGGGSLWDVFKKIHQAIGMGLNLAGVPAKVLEEEEGFKIPTERTAACFASPSKYELTINGKKAVGTAQRRIRNTLLVHGSIPIKSTYQFLFDVLNFPSQRVKERAYKNALSKMTSIYDETGLDFTPKSLASYIVEGIEKIWHINVEEGKYTSWETENIHKLSKNKYSHPNWLYLK